MSFQNRIRELVSAVASVFDEPVFGLRCPECGGKYPPENYERRAVGTDCYAYYCPSCGELVA